MRFFVIFFTVSVLTNIFVEISYTALSQIILFASISWLYGIYKKKSAWMLPFEIFNFLGFASVILFYVLFFGSFFKQFPQVISFRGEPYLLWIYLYAFLPVTGMKFLAFKSIPQF